MRKWVLGSVGLLTIVAVAAAVWINRGGTFGAVAAVDGKPALRLGKDGKPKPDVTLEFTSREVVQPALVTMSHTIEFSGPLVAPSTAVVRSKAAGTLVSLSVGEGSRVKAGQMLGVVELAELNSRVAERNAMLESAKAQLAQVERTHESNQRLADQHFISPQALDASRSALETAQAQARAAKAQLDATRVGLREAVLVAPIAGLVQKRHVVPGEKLSMEQQVFTIVDLARLELAGSVGTHEVSRLAPGMPVQVRIEGHDQDVTGRLARIAPAAEAGTRSIGVTIELANPNETFRAGQYAVARVVLPDPTQRLAVPASAIGNAAGQDHVWLIENGALVRRAVTTGRRDDREARVEVLQGLSSANQVLAARFDNLREGAKAVVVARTAPVASASASSAVLSK